MLTLRRLLFSSLRSLVRSRAALQAEILALRHQLQVLERSARGRRLRLQTADRIFWVWLLEPQGIPPLLDLEESSPPRPAL
jgi:hypothetical protein